MYLRISQDFRNVVDTIKDVLQGHVCLADELHFINISLIKQMPLPSKEYQSIMLRRIDSKTISTTDNGRSHLARDIMTTTARISKYQRNRVRY